MTQCLVLSSLLLKTPLHHLSRLPKWLPLPALPVGEVGRFSLHTQVLSNLTHDARLSDLWDYFEIEVRGSLKRRYKRMRSKDRQARDKALAKKECNKRCNNILFSYPATTIYRHSGFYEFGQKLIDLEYRYCKDCNRIMPKSVILEMDMVRYTKRHMKPPKRSDCSPILCPCCRARTARIEVLIRKTKMAQYLFEGEGY